MSDVEKSHADLALAFNEWMRRYTEEPETFRHEMRIVSEFLKEQADGKESSYGDNCAAYISQIMAEQREAGQAVTADAPPPPEAQG